MMDFFSENRFDLAICGHKDIGNTHLKEHFQYKAHICIATILLFHLIGVRLKRAIENEFALK